MKHQNVSNLYFKKSNFKTGEPLPLAGFFVHSILILSSCLLCASVIHSLPMSPCCIYHQYSPQTVTKHQTDKYKKWEEETGPFTTRQKEGKQLEIVAISSRGGEKRFLIWSGKRLAWVKGIDGGNLVKRIWHCRDKHRPGGRNELLFRHENNSESFLPWHQTAWRWPGSSRGAARHGRRCRHAHARWWLREEGEELSVMISDGVECMQEKNNCTLFIL